MQIVREALSNVGRHGAATTCRVSVERNAAGLMIETHDDPPRALSDGPQAVPLGEMGALITDQMLDVFTVAAPLDRIGAALRQRYDGVLDRVFSYMPYVPGQLDDAWRAIVAAVRA